MLRGNETYTTYEGECGECGRPFVGERGDSPTCDHPNWLSEWKPHPIARLSSAECRGWIGHPRLKRKDRPYTEYSIGAYTDGTRWLGAEDVAYEFAPASVPALSASGRAWFKATARNLNAYGKRTNVPQRLDTLRKACASAASTSTGETWFVFNDMGGIALTLRCDRDSALAIALGWNEAGGSAVLMSPRARLDDCATSELVAVPDDQCIAIPDELPEAAPEPARDYLSAFAGDDGLRYTTPHGLVGIGRCRHEADRSVALVDPTKAGPAARETTKPHYEDPQDYAVAGWLEALHSANVLVAGYDGPSRKLPTPVTLLGKARKARRKMDALRWTADGRTFFYDLDRVKMLTKGTKTVRLDVLGTDAMRDCPLRVTRDDGLVGYTGQLDVSSYEVIG